MAESLRRLVNIGTFTVLQEKLERWLDNYYINTCDQNVARCCEIIELNAKVQGQLFKLLQVTAESGGMYGGASIIKSRLLPFLGQNFFTSGGSVTADTSLSVLAEAAAKNREIDDLQDMYETSLNELEADLKDKEAENQDLRDELLDAKTELDRSTRTSTSDKIFLENENRDLRRKLALAEDEVRTLRSKAGMMTDYETQIRHLRDDIALLTARRDSLYRSTSSFAKDDSILSSTIREEKKPGLADAQDEIHKLRSKAGLVDDYERQVRNLRDELSLASTKKSYLDNDVYSSLGSYRYTPRVGSPLSIDDPVQRVRQQNYISRWNDMFSQDRLDAMDTLRRYSDDYENNQRIIFLAIQEAFSVAKLAFRQFKMKVRANLAATHIGPETLEEAVQDYINRNTDLCDLTGMVADVIRALNRSPKVFLPPDATFSIVQPFIRESCKLAWNMSALAHPLDIAVATDAELFDNNKYRRSYDSEYTAPLVNHHIWPALMQGAKVLMKGEACTRRGASLIEEIKGASRRSRSPTRSVSPSPRPRSRSRSASPSRRIRSRSVSPSRSRSPFSSGAW
ncbi:mitochondria-eating protein-like isoform X1 [Crassostrea angulata]|uniref:mitochondria-eating protein-like isoform X1 n=1 Tax=Magallana angulata TaxID=2784310 RepID=UPI0005C3784E|nr:mitochondria-eating protein-like isoform X1 [Crassostrea angulata]|eukprot:XP_011417414.1 PREDICTED: mitochondria-eating protein isoform X2 [Crassostrea gigas]